MILPQKDIEAVGQFIIDQLGIELIKQDHKATGRLISSLEYRLKGVKELQSSSELTNTGGNASIEVWMNDYGRYVNTGRKRGARKVPIQALVDWIKQKGIETNNKKVLGIAFAIQKTIEKEGIPTANSRKRGKRIEFVDDTLTRIEDEISRRLLNAASESVLVSLDNLVKA